ncbi:MAG: adenylate/guanylate cyclase domain-containing protein [Candidatus Binataceae bacterium]
MLSGKSGGAKFCNACASPMVATCPRCGANNKPEAKFCNECAAPLDASTPATATDNFRDAAQAERRHLTILFCDLVGSTAIAAQLDPEEWRETVAGYQLAAAEAITGFEGYVARYVGDGVLAFFGYPAAHDNDAERAVRASLALLDALERLNQAPGHAKLSARIGVNSGPVVVGGGTGQEADVFGDAANLAARVQAAAAPGTVAISAATLRLVAACSSSKSWARRRSRGLSGRLNSIGSCGRVGCAGASKRRRPAD